MSNLFVTIELLDSQPVPGVMDASEWTTALSYTPGLPVSAVVVILQATIDALEADE